MGHACLPTREARAFFAWGAGSYAAVALILLAFALRRTGGTMIYALDDPAIHLSIADNLVHHGTWGIEPGHFQSASSSPLWTILLAGLVGALPFAANYLAFAMNALAAVAIIGLLARFQRTLLPSFHRPLDVLAVVTISVVVLFLPAATFVGMEHLLHAALVLAAVHLVLHPPIDRASPGRQAAPYVLIAMAAATRLETVFVVAAVVVAVAVVSDDGVALTSSLRRNLSRLALLGGSVALPVLAFSLFNKAMGQSWLPNSVIAKSRSLNGAGQSFDLTRVFNQLTSDAVLALLATVCTVLVIVGWRDRRSWVRPALVMPLATLAHITFAQVGWYERYQIYLIVLGVYAVAIAARELIPLELDHRQRAPAGLLVLVVLVLCATKISLTVEVPRAVDDTYQQRYQAARFLNRYYRDQPVATGELGYISLIHDGPITDLFGLGDYEVMQARRTFEQRPPALYWTGLADRRGFKVSAVYPSTLLFDTPKDWVLVGTWSLPRPAISGFDSRFQFWATQPEEVASLIQHLKEFEGELPGGVRQEINSLAQFRADTLIRDRDG